MEVRSQGQQKLSSKFWPVIDCHLEYDTNGSNQPLCTYSAPLTYSTLSILTTICWLGRALPAWLTVYNHILCFSLMYKYQTFSQGLKFAVIFLFPLPVYDQEECYLFSCPPWVREEGSHCNILDWLRRTALVESAQNWQVWLWLPEIA